MQNHQLDIFNPDTQNLSIFPLDQFSSQLQFDPPDFSAKISIQIISQNNPQSAHLQYDNTNIDQSHSYTKSFQSILHNCTKHLITILIKILKNIQFQQLFAQNQNQTKQAILRLVDLIKKVWKGQIKNGQRKQMLKIIFEDNSEKVQRFKLNKDEKVIKIFEELDERNLRMGRNVLREYVLQKFKEYKELYVRQSRINKKRIISIYIDNFLNELENKAISLRMPKQEKKRMFISFMNELYFKQKA